MSLAMACASLGPGLASPAGTTAAASPLVIGETFTIESRILGETRRINVYLPPAYTEAPGARLPVLYMPDGGMAEDFLHVAGLVQVSTGNGTMRPFLLVGIENTERRRDLTGPTENAEDRKIAPRVGGSVALRADVGGEALDDLSPGCSPGVPCGVQAASGQVTAVVCGRGGARDGTRDTLTRPYLRKEK